MDMNLLGQDQLIKEVNKTFESFKLCDSKLPPHFILNGPPGTAKRYIIQNLSKQHGLGFLDIEPNQIIDHGTISERLSKALSPLIEMGSKPSVVFVNEFDKLIISDNSKNGDVQNEFLNILESETIIVVGSHGKYIPIPTKEILFVFAGVFSGEEEINIDRLREIGIKTEFLRCVGLVFNTKRPSKTELMRILMSKNQ